MSGGLAPRSPLVKLPNLDRIIRGLLVVFIGVLPFKGLLFIERNGFLILLALLGLWCLANRRHFLSPTPVNVPLAAFVVWVGLTIPLATYPLYSLKEFGKLLQQGVIFYAVIFFLRDRLHWTRLVWLLMGVFGVVTTYGAVWFEETIHGGSSFLPSEVWLTTYLVMMLPLGCALAWYEPRPWIKGLCVAGTIVGAVCLVLTQSRAGLVALLVELWALAWLLRHRAMTLIAAGVTVLFCVSLWMLVRVDVAPDGQMRVTPRVDVEVKTSTMSFVHRLDIWAFMLRRIAEHPVVGIGYGKETSKMLFGQVAETNLAPGHAPVRVHGAHNIFLELALLVGVPGMALFVWLGITSIRMVISGFRHATDPFAQAVLLGISTGLIGLAVRIQFDQMFVGTLAIQCGVLLGVAVLVCHQADHPETAGMMPGSEPTPLPAA